MNKRSNQISESQLLSELINKYTQYLNVLFLKIGQSEVDVLKLVEKLVENCFKKSKDEGNFPENKMAIMVLNRKNNNNQTINEYVLRIKKDGVIDEDIDDWWSLNDVERKLIFEIENYFINFFLALGEESGLKGDDVVRFLMKNKSVYDNFNHPFFSGDSAPLPIELRNRVNKCMNSFLEDDTKFNEELNNYPSMNAFLRHKITMGDL